MEYGATLVMFGARTRSNPEEAMPGPDAEPAPEGIKPCPSGPYIAEEEAARPVRPEEQDGDIRKGEK